jgi:nucleotide-binding universal stress UspA family protein
MNTSVVAGSVVVGVDGSPQSEVAVEWAVEYAESHHRPLTIVYALGDALTDGSPDYPTRVRRKQHVAGARITEDALATASRLAPALDVSVCVSEGVAHDVLLAAAEHASVLVVGTRGRGRLGTLLLGSVSVGLLTHAPCPVVVARRPVDQLSSAQAKRGVVVGVDGTEASTGAIAFAFELAAARHESLQVAHAVGVGSYGLIAADLWTYEQRLDVAEEHEVQVAESVAGFQEKYPDVVVSWQLIEGDATADLVHLSMQASTVVVGSRGRGDAAALLLGSVSRGVVVQAHCPVVVVRGTAVDNQ